MQYMLGKQSIIYEAILQNSEPVNGTETFINQ